MLEAKRLYRIVRPLLLVAFFAFILCLGGAPNYRFAARAEEEIEGVEIPRIIPHPLPTNVRLQLDPRLLPTGARAFFPAFDGDSFFVSIPPKSVVTPPLVSQVFTGVIVPILQAIGFSHPQDIASPSNPTLLPPANLSELARDTCLELDGIPQLKEICEVMQGHSLSPELLEQVEQAFQDGEGMSFQQFKADIERQRIQYVFRQHVEGVPIEHTGIIASRWEGETVTTVHGAVFNQFVVANEVVLMPPDAAQRALQALAMVRGVVGVQADPPTRVELLLLPDGAVMQKQELIALPALRYAYRMLIRGAIEVPGTPPHAEGASWLLWLDAQTGRILQLAPQFNFISTPARGRIWRRAPDTFTETVPFEVDSAVGGQYTLRLSGVFNQIDQRKGRLDVDDEVSISDSANGSSATWANFDQDPINSDATAICECGPYGGNDAFRQVNAYAHLYRLWREFVYAGTSPSSFPESALTVWVDSSSPDFAHYDANLPGQPNYDPTLDKGPNLNYAIGSLFVATDGCEKEDCRNEHGHSMNSAQDATSIAHEFGHLRTLRLQARRPCDWCDMGMPCDGMTPCPVLSPTGHLLFHDFADAWANEYASTNCVGGWLASNRGDVRAHLNCAGMTAQGGGLPRRVTASNVSIPSTPGEEDDEKDHFPDHRIEGQRGGYADGQIAAAALWEVRKGMRSKCLPSGTPQYLVRLTRALWDFGSPPGTTCPGTVCPDGTPCPEATMMCPRGTTPCSPTCDRDIYRYLHDLFVKMVHQWATSGQPGGLPGFEHNGAHTTNKVTSGFARAGIFSVPYQCIDGDPSTYDPCFCPLEEGGENGGDAVIDIDDNDNSDDVTVDEVVHPEVDYLEAGGQRPTFHVWTGPRYQFIGGTAVTSVTPPCNAQFQVEVSNDADFPIGSTITSGFIWVDPMGETPDCYGIWKPTWPQWNLLNDDERIYYRVRTRDAMGGNERISTMPIPSGSPDCNPLTVPPPYAIINPSGTPDSVVAHINPVGGTAVPITVTMIALCLPVGVLAVRRRRARRQGDRRFFSQPESS